MKALQYLAGFLLFLLVWWGGSLLAGSAVLPAPPAVLRYLADPAVLSRVAAELVRTLARGIAGFLAALVIALPAGILMGRRGVPRRAGFFPLLMLQSAPPLFWITPLVLWLGVRGPVPVVVATLVTLPLLALHTTMAIRHIPPWEFDVFAVYAPRRRVVLRELYVPHLVPALRSNVHLGVLVAVKAAMLAEWFAAPDGFGRSVRIFYQTFAMVEFVTWAFLFLVITGGLSFGLEHLLRRGLREYRVTDSTAALRSDAVVHETTSTEPASSALRTAGLTFGYHRHPLFSNVSLEIHRDIPMVLYGESGCGKTTLLKCLAGVLTPWAGLVDSRGKPGLVFQDDSLLRHRDALGNVLLPAMPNVTAADVQRARKALDLWGLGEREHAFPHELSGGMRKRLAMARAWFLAPQVLLLDEPFVNLDREARVVLWDLFFQRLRETGMAALIVTHYREEIAHHRVSMVGWQEISAEKYPPQ